MSKTQRMMLLIFAVCAAPFVLGTLAYFFYKPEGRINYGELLPTKPIALPTGTTLSGAQVGGAEFKGKWWLLHTCGADCETELYASRQVRTMLNKDKEKVQRLILVASPPSDEIKAKHPDAQWLVGSATPSPHPNNILLVDPLSNQVLVWPKLPDIKRMHKDLGRLMRVNQTGK
jgi:hypothetical protein